MQEVSYHSSSHYQFLELSPAEEKSCLALVSREREIFSRYNFGSFHHSEQKRSKGIDKMTTRLHSSSNQYYNHPISDRGIDHLMNTAIVDHQSRRASIDFFLTGGHSSRRYSLMGRDSNRRYSLSHGSDHFPGMSLQELDKIDATQHGYCNDAKMYQHPLDSCDTKGTFEKFIDLDESILYLKKKKLLKSVDQMNQQPYYMTYEDELTRKATRRNSIYSLSHSRRNSICSIVNSDDEEDDFSFLRNIRIENLMLDNSMRDMRYPSEHHLVNPIPVYPAPMSSSTSVTATQPPLRPIDYIEIKHMMEAFAESMSESQKSQQSIHDWDKKMGLKRSHSKTMRLSMRTRKKLRTIMKKEINSSCSSQHIK
jgi:hypothetical protein